MAELRQSLFFILWLSIFVVSSVVSVAATQPNIVEAGQPCARIVIADQPQPMIAIAAEELQTFIERMSGAELPIGTEPDKNTVNIFVGQSTYTDRFGLKVGDLEHDAYRIASGANWLVLLGRDDQYEPVEPWAHGRGDYDRVRRRLREVSNVPMKAGSTFKSYNKELDVWEQDGRGTINAVYGFLRSLGCRWYFPGEIGKVVPTRKTIKLPEVNKTVRPDFPMRNISQYYKSFFQTTAEEIKWQWWLGLNTGHDMWGGGHGLTAVTRTEEIKRSHPEYFALFSGKRDVEGGDQCLSSGEFRKMMSAYARFKFDYFNTSTVDLSPNDGYTRLCECPLCKGSGTFERGRSGQLSDYVWGFINRVAKDVYRTHPEHYVSGIVYTSYLQRPLEIEQFSPNVAVTICTWRTWQGENARYKPAEIYQLRKDWLALLPSDRLFRWDYYLHAGREAWRGVPVYFPHLIDQDLKWLKGRSMGEHIETFRNWRGWDRDWRAMAVNHLNVYVTSRLYWDAEQDVDDILNEYYDKFYGPAADEMQTFIAYAERHWRQATADEEVISRLLELIDSAQTVAGKENVYAERVEMVAHYMEPLAGLQKQLAVGRENNPAAEIARRGSRAAPQMDGKIDEDFWTGMRTYRLRDCETGREPAHPTRFRMAWTGDSLYVGVHCTDHDMATLNIASNEHDNMGLWGGDALELLLETPDQKYYQIAIAPSGAVTDLKRGRGLQTAWDAQAETAVHHGEDYWSVELRLPVPGEGHAEFFPDENISGAQPSRTFPWYFNICRQRKRDGQMQTYAFSPTGKRGFHDVLRFAKLYVR